MYTSEREHVSEKRVRNPSEMARQIPPRVKNPLLYKDFLPSDCRSSPGPIFGPTELDDGPRPTRPPQPPLSVGASENKYPAVKDRSSRLLECPGRVIASIARSQDTRTDSNIVGFELTELCLASSSCKQSFSRIQSQPGIVSQCGNT